MSNKPQCNRTANTKSKKTIICLQVHGQISVTWKINDAEYTNKYNLKNEHTYFKNYPT